MGYFINVPVLINITRPMILLIILVAPTIQIVLSSLRIRDRISTPIGVIALFMILLGFILTYIGQIVMGNDAPPGEARGTISFAFLLIGNLVTIIIVLIIAIISGIQYYYTHKNKDKA